MFRRYTGVTSIGILAGALLLQASCLSEEAAFGSAVAVDLTTQALTSVDLASVNGTYAGCRNRGGPWSLEIATGATLDNGQLTVIMNDVGCALTLTELHTTAGAITAVPALGLTTAFTVAPPSFGSPIEFYANARLSSVAFASDFILTILYSDDSNLATGDNTAGFAVVMASATAQSVPAPDYTLDVSGLAVLTDLNDIVQSVTGSATLTVGLVTGQTYVLLNAAGLDTYAEIDSAYLLGTAAALPASIAAVDFALVGADLTIAQVRTLIIANISNGVASYQEFEMTINKAL